jgi:hypothetical protein
MRFTWLNAFRNPYALHTRKHGRRRPCTLVLEALEERTVPSTFVISNAADSGPGSLRQAILDSNAQGGANIIQFGIANGPPTISVGSTTGKPLPQITDSVTIDGTTQPGYNGTPIVELDGTSAGANAYGLNIAAPSCLVKGLVINRFSQAGIIVQTGSGTVIEGNYLDVDVGGNTLLANTGGGIAVAAPGTTVGGTAPGAGNVIGNGISIGYGVLDSADAASTFIQGNTIGLGADGTTSLGNDAYGIYVVHSHNVVIGGPTEAARNVISGNLGFGIITDAVANGMVIQGNYIGTDRTGELARPNTYFGIAISSPGVQIGGLTATPGTGPGNVISANGKGPHSGGGIAFSATDGTGDVVNGNIVGLDAAGTTALNDFQDGGVASNASNITVGSTAAGAGNVISGNAAGVSLKFGSGSVVEGNYVGTDITGTHAVGNRSYGVVLSDGASGNIVGGTTTAARNVISGNTTDGILITDLGSDGNIVEGNYIGTDTSGAVALPNGVGIEISTSNNVIGGTTAGTRNVISGNATDGVLLDTLALNGATLASSATGNQIMDNSIGTDATGTLPLGNGLDGVEIKYDGNSVTGNVISGNAGDGVQVDGRQAGTDFNTISQNDIGTGISGTNAVPNARDGIDVASASPNSIYFNLISANGLDGIFLGSAATGNEADANFIGTNQSGTAAIDTHGMPLGNGANGIEVLGTNNGIGEPDGPVGLSDNAYGNLISGNLLDGVLLGAGATGNTIQNNAVGTDITGTHALANLGDGVEILGSANTVGGDTGTIGSSQGADGNVISGNGVDGILVDAGATANVIQGNYVGTTVSGTAALANLGDGIEVAGNNMDVGGTTFGTRNVVSGNRGDGVAIDSGATGVAVQGNLIGTDITGKMALPNRNGVDAGGINDVIGGLTAGARNVIAGNTGAGVLISSSATGAQEQGNYVGTDTTGTTALANGTGVEVAGSGNTVGGMAGAARNIISGNVNDGVLIDPGAANDLVQGNYIGTDRTGSKILPNNNGVEVAGTNNTVGGAVAAARNVISGNSDDGVLVDAGATGVQVQNNFVGTDFSGTQSVPNGTFNVASSTGTGAGIELAGSGDTIGGAAAGQGNLISGNANENIRLDKNATNDQVQGNDIGTDTTGTKGLGGQIGIEIDGFANMIGGVVAAARNVISGNTHIQVHLDTDATNDSLQGNYIGTDVTGTKGIGNYTSVLYGVQVDGSSNLVGGPTSTQRNVISGNYAGIYMVPSANHNQVESNYIGTDVSGTVAVPNVTGIEVFGNDQQIGGLEGSGGNLISGNTAIGVLAEGDNMVVQGNFIGTDVSGTQALANRNAGIDFVGKDGLIGDPNGKGPGTFGNLISGNGEGIVLVGALPHNNIRVVGNMVGTDITGTHAIPDVVGIDVGDFGDTIGSAPNGANLISGNSAIGILIRQSFSGNQVQANEIGTTLAGNAALPNRTGIEIDGNNNTIGGTVTLIRGMPTSAGNIVAYNQVQGVLILGTGNTISENSVFSNGPQQQGIGLVLYGSHEQVAPIIAVRPKPSYDQASGTLKVTGSFAGTVGTIYTLEFFANPATLSPQTGQIVTDPEGQTYIGSATLKVTASGAHNFTLPVNLVTTAPFLGYPSPFITATATNQTTGDTSGFSAAVEDPPLRVAPAFTSARVTAFTVATAGSFTVTASGFPGPVLTERGVLPRGVTFDPASGTLSGKPAIGSSGTYRLLFTASNGGGTTAIQAFTVTVKPLVSLVAVSNQVRLTPPAVFTPVAGSPGEFTGTYTVVNSGPALTCPVVLTFPPPPAGVTLIRSNAPTVIGASKTLRLTVVASTMQPAQLVEVQAVPYEEVMQK